MERRRSDANYIGIAHIDERVEDARSLRVGG
nr:MAG TPA: hypothetical protein [Caudoviricetes sp.]